MDRETELPSRNSTSSSSSLPPRAPDLLRQVQAVFKRHRPLSGNISSSVLSGRRLMHAPPVPLETKEESSELGRETGSGKVDFVVEGSSLTSSSSASTITGMQEAGNLGRAPGHRITSLANVSSDCKAERLVSTEISAADVQKEVHLCSFDKAGNSSSGADSQKSECLLASKVCPMSINNQDEFRGRNFHQAEMSDVSTLLAKKDVFATGGSSYSTTTSVSSMSAPMLNSSAYCRSLVMDAETGEEFNLKPQPRFQGNPVGSLGTTSQIKSANLSSQMAESTRNSVSAPETSLITQEANPKENDNLKAVHIADKSSKGQQDLISGGGKNVNSQGSTSRILSSSSVEDSLKPGMPEKATRKKNSNSDFFFKVNGKRYQKLGKIGSGGSSEVHKVISADCTIYALKKINLKGRDYSTAYGFCQEIEYLKRLKGNNHIIQLVDYEVTDKTLFEEVISGSMTAKDSKIRVDGYIYMVLEYGEIDLAHMLMQKWKDMDISNSKIDENWLRFYWQQILIAVNTIHEERIVHSDLKPANFLLVRGSLKLIDFGIAKAIMSDTTNIQRDAQVGTLNYMSPEAFMWNEQDENGNTIKCGRPSDIWSLGCILYQMVYGRTPFAEHKTFWAKFKVITNPNHKIKYETLSNPWLIDLMKRCLAWDRNARWRIPQLLLHPFLNPPVPQVDPLRTYHLKSLMEIAEAYKDNSEVSGLCSQLQLVIMNHAKV